MCFVEYFDLFMDLDVGTDDFVADCTRPFFFLIIIIIDDLWH